MLNRLSIAITVLLLLPACQQENLLESSRTRSSGTILHPTSDDYIGDFLVTTKLPNDTLVTAFLNETKGALEIGVAAPGTLDFDRTLLRGPDNTAIGYGNDLTADASGTIYGVTFNKTTRTPYAFEGKPGSISQADLVEIDDGMRKVEKEDSEEDSEKEDEDIKMVKHSVGIRPKITADANGGLHLSYYDRTAGCRYYRYKAAGATDWGKYQKIEPRSADKIDGVYSTNSNFGRYADMGYSNQLKKVFVAVRDAFSQILYLAEADVDDNNKEAEREWFFSIIDADGDVGHYVTLDIDSQGKPVVAYYNAIKGNLMLARPLEEDSSPQVVDSSGNVGIDPALRLDKQDRAHIAYLMVSGKGFSYDFARSWETSAGSGNFNRHIEDKSGITGFFGSLELLNDGSGVSFWHVSFIPHPDATRQTHQKVAYEVF